VDTPTYHNFVHLLDNLIADLLAVLEDVVKSRVGDLIPDDGARHGLQSCVCHVIAATCKIEILVGLERIVAVNGPLDKGLHFKTLVLLGYLLCLDFDLDEVRGESSDLVKWASEAEQSDAGLNFFSVAHDDDPLIRFSNHSQCHHILVDVKTQLV
jgi:hypothetical protein